MEPDRGRRQDKHQSGQGFGPVTALPGDGDAVATGDWKGCSAASEAMALAYGVTRTPTEIYELLAGLAGTWAAPSQAGTEAIQPPFIQHLVPLSKIIAAIEESERRVLLLGSETAGTRHEMFDAFIEDCRAALAAFREASGDLAGIIGPDGSRSPGVTVSETLTSVMKRLETCSERVLRLPETGMAVSYQCLAETAFELRYRAEGLVGRTVNSA